MLLLFGFSESEVAILLDTSPQRVTNIKSRANRKIFEESSAMTLLANLRNLDVLD